MFKLSRAIIVFALISLSSQLWAHGGVANVGNTCRLSVGPYKMNFAGYQAQNGTSERFCDDLPVIGKSIITLDFIDGKLRDMTVNFRVIKVDKAPLGTEEDGKVKEDELTQKPFFEIPAKQYPNGIMTINQNFTEKGYFVGYLIAETKDDKYISRFPFSVGYDNFNILSGINFKSPWPFIGFFVVMAILSLFIGKQIANFKKRRLK